MVSAGGVIAGLMLAGVASYVTYAVVTAKPAGAVPGPVTSPPNVPAGNVQWDPVNSSLNTVISGNTITKSDNFDGWEQSGAVSLQQITGAGYVQLSAPEIITSTPNNFPGMTVIRGAIAFGITTSQSIKSLNDIDYCFRLNDDGSLQILENGVPVLDPDYSPGDILKVHNNNGQVMYHQNGNVLYVSLTPLSVPWKAACAIFNSGQSVTGMQIQSM